MIVQSTHNNILNNLKSANFTLLNIPRIVMFWMNNHFI